jgi:hypothetical protein
MDALGQLILGQAAPTEPPKSAFPNPYLENVFKQLIPKEGGRYDNPPHPLSSAQGAYGITAPAYSDIQKNDPYFQGKPQNQLTPQEQDRAAVVLREKVQVPALRQFGVEPTEPNIQLSHFLGPAGAAQFLKNGYISPEAAAANGGMQNAQKIAQDRLAFGAKLAQSQQQTQQAAPQGSTQAPQTAPQPTGDALGDMILGVAPAQPAQPTAQPTQAAVPPTGQEPVAEPPSAVSSAAQRRFAGEPQAEPQPAGPRSFTDYAKETGKSVASFLDNTIGAAIPSVVSMLGYPIAKIVETTALATGGKFDAADAIHSIVEPISQPFAKAFGIDANDPAYKREISNRFMTFVGENIGKGAKELSDAFYDKTGVRIPTADFEQAANIGLVALTAKGAPVVGKGVKTVAGVIEDQFAAKKGEPKPIAERIEPGTVVSEGPGIRVEYQTEGKPGVRFETPEYKELAAKRDQAFAEHDALVEKANKFPEGSAEQVDAFNSANDFFAEKAFPLVEQLNKIRTDELAGQPAATQLADQFTAKKGAAEVPTTVETQLGQQLEAKQAPIKVTEENPPMPSAKPTVSGIRERQNVLDEVGINVHRKSALEGNPKEASSQYITAKADQGPYATGMTEQINFEKKALDSHFGRVAESAGGEVPRYGTPDQQGDLIKVGSKVKDALGEGYKAHIAEGKKLYQDAAAAHGDKPVTVEKFGEFLKQDENFAYEKEKGLQSAVKTYMTRKGLMDKDGNIQPMTVADAEGVRQFINDKYNYETSGLIGKMKRQIDDQVFEQVGGETYQRARAHWAKGKETYENPKAIGDLLSDRGVNEKIAAEDVMSKVSGLKQKQFAHLLDTLRADGQKAAVDQIKTSLVDEIRRAGQSGVNEPFNSIKATKTAAALGEKLKVAFADDPKGLKAIYTGLEAANIVHIPTAYPGAAVQTNLLKNKFTDFAIRRGAGITGGAVGTFLGGPGYGTAAGVAAGEYAGSKIVGSRATARQQSQLRKELTTAEETMPLSDILKIKPRGK